MKYFGSKMLLSGLAVCLVAAWIALCNAPLRAQTVYGSITGSVTDPSGAAIPGAQVTLTNPGTTESRTQRSGTDGLYSFVNLLPGHYQLEVKKEGFQRFLRPEVVVEVQQTYRIDVIMQLGAVTQEVTVTGATPLLQPETTTLGPVIGERAATELPLNGRNVFNLMALAPSVVPQNQANGTPVGVNPFGWGNYQINGSFANESVEYLDGQPLNIGYVNLPILIPMQDSVQEFKVQTSNLGPEFGKFAGGVMNISTKGGSNALHGEAYEFLRNKRLNANDFFLNAAGRKRPPWVQNQFGANAGGPFIIPGKYDGRQKGTFWWFGWESFRLRTATPFTTTVPAAAEKAGDFSALKVPIRDACGGSVSAPVACPSFTGSPTTFAGNVIPASRINPTSRALLNLWPAPNAPGTIDPVTGINRNNFVTSATSGGNQNQWVVRGDQKITNNQRLFVRHSYWNLTDLPIDPLGTGVCADRCTEIYHTNATAIGWNWSLSPTTVLNLNASDSRFKYNRTPKITGFDLTTIGWPASFNAVVPSVMRTPPTPCVLNFSEDIMCSQGQSFIQDRNTQFNLSPSITIIRGPHTLQFGGQVEWDYDNYSQTNIGSGTFAFCLPGSQCYTGIGFADFLLGYGDNVAGFIGKFYSQAVVPALTAGKQVYRAVYGGDTWHVTRKLTLNLGLRYEIQGPWSERFNRLTYFDPSATSFLAPLTGLPIKGDVFLVEPDNGHNIRTDKTNFSPRVGFAYSLNPKTVVRAAYAINWIPNFATFGVEPINDVVNAAATSYTGTINGKVPINTIATPFPKGISPPPGRSLGSLGTSEFFAGTVKSFTSVDRGNARKFGRVEQVNFDIQRELPKGFAVSAAYVRSRGVHLAGKFQQLNQIPNQFLAQAAAGQLNLLASAPNPFFINGQALALTGPTTTVGQLLRPFPQFTGVNFAGQGSFDSVYNSFQLSAQRRFAGGGSLLVAYTASKLITNTDTLTTWLESGIGVIQDSNNLSRERSLASQDVPQRLVVSYVLDLPFGHGKKFLSGLHGPIDKAVSGWGIDGVTTIQKAFPLALINGKSNPITLFGAGSRPNVLPGCDLRSPLQGNARIRQFFNTACFAAPAPFTFGTEPRVDPQLRGDGIKNFDFAIFKRTTFVSEQKLGVEFRTEFFNLFNKTRFAPPNVIFGLANFGVVNSTANGSFPRLIQFGLKFLF